jgi:hypothetical protein
MALDDGVCPPVDPMGKNSAELGLGIAVSIDPWQAPIGRGHHFAGKVWMRNGETLKRVALTEIALYEKNGYYRSGPRGK